MPFQTDLQAKHNDAQLIRSALRGEPDALETLFARHNRALYQTALRVLGNPEDAEDALQEGLLSAYRNLRRFEGRSQFRPVLSLEEGSGEDELPLAERFADAGPNPEQVYERKELHEMLEENLADLSPLLRTAFRLREVEGLSTEEAAKTLGVSENTLKARLWRARQQLVARLAMQTAAT